VNDSTITPAPTTLPRPTTSPPLPISSDSARPSTSTLKLCNVPTYSSVSANAVVTQFAILGCSHEHPECCVHNSKSNTAGLDTLTKCPIDYFQTSSGCCPSGWSIYSTVLGSSTPCYTVPPTPFSISIPHLPSIAPSTTFIPDKIFALQYPLAQPTKKGGLSSGAKIGINVTLGVIFLLIIMYLIFLWLRRYRRSSSPKLDPPSKEISLPSTIPQIEAKQHIRESSVAGEFAKELEGDLSDVRRYSSQETLLELELKQRPPADPRR